MAGDNDKKGFGGFDDLLSDVSKELEGPVAKPKTQSTPRQSPQPKVEPIPQNTPGGKKGSGIAWVVFFFLILIVMSFLGKKSEVPTSTSNYQQTYTTPEEEATAPEPAYIAPAPESAPIQVNNIEEMPPVGNGLVFNNNQIRYCVFEDVRLETIQKIINSYSQNEVDNFNANVSDYNSRCHHYKYRAGALEGIQSEVIVRHAALVVEGLDRLKSWRREVSQPTISQRKIDTDSKDISTNSNSSSAALLSKETQDLNDLTQDERSAIQSVCRSDNTLYGPAAYYKCLASQINQLK